MKQLLSIVVVRDHWHKVGTTIHHFFRNAIVSISFALIFLCGLASCGGGGTSGGGGGGSLQKDVTSCISHNASPADGNPEPDPIFDVLVNTYTNNCEFSVNLGVQVFWDFDTITVPAGESVSLQYAGMEWDRFIACRPPSVVEDKNDDPLGVELGCS